MAGTRTGNVTRRKTVRRRSPSNIADSSTAGSRRRRAARVASVTYGNDTRMSTRAAPPNPPMDGSRSTPSGASSPWRVPRGPKKARNANPTTYEGMASGMAVRTAHQRRPGRSVRVVSQAIGTPIPIVPAPTSRASAIVPKTAPRVRGRITEPSAPGSASSARISR
jgi:hypothetical protein